MAESLLYSVMSHPTPPSVSTSVPALLRRGDASLARGRRRCASRSADNHRLPSGVREPQHDGHESEKSHVRFLIIRTTMHFSFETFKGFKKFSALAQAQVSYQVS
jgi:hypothetical protein